MILLPKIIKSLQCEMDIMRLPSTFVNTAIGALSGVSQEQPYSDMQKQAEEIISSARKKAVEITEKAEKEAADIVKMLEKSTQERCTQLMMQSEREGYEKGLLEGKTEGIPLGFQEGYEEGLARAENENRYMIDCLKEMTQDFSAEKERVLQSLYDGLDDLVLTIAKAVLKREVEIHPEFLAQSAFDAVSEYNADAWIKIYVSEKMHQTIMENRPDFLDSLQGNVKLIANSDMSDTDCVCETPTKMVDAGIDTQFENITLIMSENL